MKFIKMKFFNRKFLAITLVMVGGYIALDFANKSSIPTPLEKQYQSYQVYTGETDIAESELLADGKAAALRFKTKQTKAYRDMKKYGKPSVLKNSRVRPIVSDSNYLVFMNANLKALEKKDGESNDGSVGRYSPDHIKRKSGETWDLIVYKKEGEKLLKTATFDLFDISESERTKIFINQGRLVHLKNGHIGLSIGLGIAVGYLAYLDIETGKIEEQVELQDGSTPNEGDGDFLNLIYPEVYNGKHTKNNFAALGETDFWVYGTQFDTKRLKQLRSKLPLASDNPKALNILSQKHSYLSMMVGDTENHIRDYATVLNLISPYKKDIFHYFKMSKEMTKDKKEHIVGSYEEYKKYYSPAYSWSIRFDPKNSPTRK